MSQKRAKSEPRSNEARRRAAYLKYRLSPRARDLFDDLIRQRGAGPHGAYLESQCLRVAELTATAETLRAELDKRKDGGEAPTAAQITAVVRIEGVARRAAADLLKMAPAKSEDDVEYADLIRRYRTGSTEEGATDDHNH
jgi:hypothetical protein